MTTRHFSCIIRHLERIVYENLRYFQPFIDRPAECFFHVWFERQGYFFESPRGGIPYQFQVALALERRQGCELRFCG